jgi:Zn-finger nucleic acid-binding protein
MDNAAGNLRCPVCDVEMETLALGDGEVERCPEGHGVFLPRPHLGTLIEAETDWHTHVGQHTAPMPRITADMTAPPPSRAPARAWVETLFS